MKTIDYPKIKETLFYEQCPNGLQVFILQKKGFSKTYATLSTQLGGINQVVYKNDEPVLLPEGIAHFLEHKLFEQQGKDISIAFAHNQANVNAFTQNNKTTYLFTATDNVLENIDLLLQFVLKPQFTEAGIKKEVGIITQEINMYLDNPHAMIYTTLMKKMFPNHPASAEILGTIDSISSLTKETLEIAHNAFYHPSQMVFFIAGNVDAHKTMEHIKQSQSTIIQPSEYTIKKPEIEYSKTNQSHTIIEADIISPQVLFGIKLPVYHAKDLVKHDLILGMLLDLLFGKSTAFYQDLLTKGLINDSFGKEATLNPCHSYALIGGDTNNPDQLLQEIKDHLQKASSISISEERFEQMKKRFVGSFVQAFNYIEFIANNFSKYHFLGHSLFEMLELYQNISIEDIYEMSKELEKPEFYTTITMISNKKSA